MSEGVMTYAECLLEAEKLGRVVVVPSTNQLFVDIDTEAQRAMFDRCIDTLGKTEKGLRWIAKPSPSGEPHHEHITVTMPRPVSNQERILLQACLGSDPMRELLSFQRLGVGAPHPTLFFELPIVAEIVPPTVATDGLDRSGLTCPRCDDRPCRCGESVDTSKGD